LNKPLTVNEFVAISVLKIWLISLVGLYVPFMYTCEESSQNKIKQNLCNMNWAALTVK